MHNLQCVTKNSKKIYNFLSRSVRTYVISLLFSVGRKNCSSMSSELGFSYNEIYRYFDVFESQRKGIEAFLTYMVRCYATEENQGVFITDCSQLIKRHAKKLENVCYDFNTSMKLVLKGMSCVTAAWTNGKVLIPLDFDFWIRKKELKDVSKYKKKTSIAQDLMLKWNKKIPFKYAALDGDYGNEYFLSFLHEYNLKYSARMPKDRIVTINGVTEKLKNHPFFKLVKNERYKTAKGTYKGIPAFFTCQKRKGVNGTKEIVFVVSNLENLTPKEHIEAYDLRWPIEKMFRTVKQHLGIQECQSTCVEKQRAHIFATFLAYTKLEIQKIYKRKKSPEQVLKNFKSKNTLKINFDLSDLERVMA